MKQLYLALLNWLEDNIACNAVLKQDHDPTFYSGNYEYYEIINESQQVLFLCSIYRPKNNVLFFKEDGPATTSIIRLTLDEENEAQIETIHKAKE